MNKEFNTAYDAAYAAAWAKRDKTDSHAVAQRKAHDAAIKAAREAANAG